MSPLKFDIDYLADRYDRSAFSCGDDYLDNYIKSRADEDIKRRAGSVLVAIPVGSNVVAGYYTLTPTAIMRGSLSGADQRKLPRYDSCNAALLGRLAVDMQFRDQKLGTILMLDALDRLKRQRDLPPALVYVDAYPAAERFYEKFSFQRTLDPVNEEDSSKAVPMYLPMRRADTAINAAIELLAESSPSP